MKLKWIAYILLVTAVTVHGIRTTPNRYGDGLEYALMMESWLRHGSPHLEASDVPHYTELKRTSGMDYPEIGWPVGGYFPSYNQDKHVCWHFCAYSFSAIPYRLVLPLVGRHAFQAFQLTNCAWWMLGVGAVMFFWKDTNRYRWFAMLLGSVLNPCVWYVPCSSPELMCWSCATCCLVALQRRWYTAAVLFAVVGSWQNTPMAFLALSCAMLSWRERNWWLVLRTSIAAVWVFLPTAYWYLSTGVLNLIAADSNGLHVQGEPGFSRTWSMMADANQGLLTYQPWLIVLLPLGLVQGLWKHRLECLTLLLAATGMMLLAQKGTNWQSSSMGLMRYMMWIMPVFLWFAALAIGEMSKRWAIGVLVVLVLSHSVILWCLWPVRESYLEPNVVAKWVWQHAPLLDNPDPQVFYGRVRHADVYFKTEFTPVAYIPDQTSGYVSKMLVHRDTLDQCFSQFLIREEYAEWLKSEATRHTSVFYVHPPAGAVVVRH